MKIQEIQYLIFLDLLRCSALCLQQLPDRSALILILDQGSLATNAPSCHIHCMWTLMLGTCLHHGLQALAFSNISDI